MSTPGEVLERQAAPVPRRHKRSTRRPRRLLAIAAVVVACGALLPVGYLVARGVAAGTSGFSETVLDAKVVLLLFNTTLLAAAVTATTIAIALPVAWLTVRTDVPGRKAWVVASALPLVIPSFVGAYSFLGALGPRGLLQGWLERFGIERLPAFYGFAGAWFVLSLITYPLALLPIRAALLGLDPAQEDAARALGRTRFSTIVRVTLPQLRSAIASGGLLVALYTVSDFGAVSLMRFESLTVWIYTVYRSSFDPTRPALLGLVLVALTVTVLVVETRTRGRTVYHATHRGVRRRSRPIALGRWKWPAFASLAVLIALALVVPIAVIAVWLGRGISSGISFGLAFGPALHSMEASFLGAVAVVVCAWPIAFLGARFSGWLARFTDLASYVGYALPGIVIALAFVFLGVRTPIYQTLGLLVFAYTVHFLPLATGSLRASIEQIHPGIEEAARSLGASPREVLRRVLLPLVRPGALTAFALVFLTVMKELPVTLLLAPAGFRTLATDVWDPASAGSFAGAALPALALIMLSSAPMALLVAREQRRTTTVY